MPAVLFEYPAKSVLKQGRMFSPKRITQELAWFKEARKTIPTIPDPNKTDWQISNVEVSIRYVRFHMHNSIGHKATVTIDRTAPSLGTS
jgi:hypothetical protein